MKLNNFEQAYLLIAAIGLILLGAILEKVYSTDVKREKVRTCLKATHEQAKMIIPDAKPGIYDICIESWVE